MSQKKPNLVVISHVDPIPRQSGQQQRVYYSLISLRVHFHVTFVGVGPSRCLNGSKAELERICDEVVLLPSLYTSSLASRVWHRARGWLFQRRTGLKWSNYVIGKVEFHPARITSLLHGRKIDLALIEYFHAGDCAKVFRMLGIPCVLDMHNILWRSFARQLEAGGTKGARLECAVSRYRVAEERSWANFDGLIAISPGERDYVEGKRRPDQHVFYAPMGLPLESWPYSRQSTSPLRVAYYGGLGSPHNAADAQRCHDCIMPVVWRRFPQAELWIIGSNPPEAITRLSQKDDRVKVTGFVPCVQDVLRTITVLICPFRGTYGFRSRLIEAMALGIPVVATSDAIFGMDLIPDQGLQLAETDLDMAAFAIKLLVDPDFALAQSLAARRQIEQRYGFEATYGRLSLELLHFISARHHLQTDDRPSRPVN